MTLQLGYVALALREPQRGARFFGDELGLPRGSMDLDGEEIPVFKIGDAALALFRAGHPFLTGRVTAGVDHLGLTTREAGPKKLVREPSPRPGPGKTQQRHLPTDLTGGACLRISAPLGLKFEGKPSAMVHRIDHVGIASTDNAAAEAFCTGRLGLALESRQTDMEFSASFESFTSDKYGVVYHPRTPRAVGGLKVSFVTLGDCEMEFLQDFDPAMGTEINHGKAGTTKQDQGAIGRFVERHGAGLHHLALKTPDIDDTLALLIRRGHRVIDRIGRPGSRRSRIGFLHPVTTGGVLVHLVERNDPDRD
jgi:catechol 2,3-dioxygenase-like lactoylglutathione lyase family enzyme